MVVECQILINRTKQYFFKPGSSVTGRIKYSIDKPTEYKAVTLSFLGLGKCIWTERSKDSSTTYVGTEELVTVVHNLLQAKDKTGILDVGDYEYPFEFYLPEEIPSSYKDCYSTISYCIELKFVKQKVLSFNKIFTTEIPVRGYVEAATIDGPVIFGLEKKLTHLFATNKPVINIKAEVEKVLVKPKNNINISMIVTNNTSLTTNVRLSLYCYKLYTANCGRTTTSFEKIKHCSLDLVSIAPHGVANLIQTLATTEDLFSVTTKILRKEYRVRVSVKLPSPHRNVSVEMPIVLGDLKTDKVVEATASEYEDNADNPPSYWEAMGKQYEDFEQKYDKEYDERNKPVK